MIITSSIDYWLGYMPYLHCHVFANLAPTLLHQILSPNTDAEHQVPFYQYTCTAILLIIRIPLFLQMNDKLTGFCISKKKKQEILKYLNFSIYFEHYLMSKQGRFVYCETC